MISPAACKLRKTRVTALCESQCCHKELEKVKKENSEMIVTTNGSYTCPVCETTRTLSVSFGMGGDEDDSGVWMTDEEIFQSR